jgi:hypothetical protein
MPEASPKLHFTQLFFSKIESLLSIVDTATLVLSIMEVADVQTRAPPERRCRKIKFVPGAKKKIASDDPLPEEDPIIVVTPDIKQIPERALERAPEQRSTRSVKAKKTRSKLSKSKNPDHFKERKETKKSKDKEKKSSTESESSAPSRSHSRESYAVDSAEDILGFDLDDDEPPSDIRDARIDAILYDDEASEDIEEKKKRRGGRNTSSSPTRGRAANKGSTMLQRLARSMSPGANREKLMKIKANSSRHKRLGAGSKKKDKTSSKKDSAPSSKKGKSPASSSSSSASKKTNKATRPSSRHRQNECLDKFDWNDEERHLSKLETSAFESMCDELGLI